jgi:hypothetical protein
MSPGTSCNELQHKSDREVAMGADAIHALLKWFVGLKARADGSQ